METVKTLIHEGHAVHCRLSVQVFLDLLLYPLEDAGKLLLSISYGSLRAEASLIRSAICPRMRANLAANATPSEADNSDLYAVASFMKLKCTVP